MPERPSSLTIVKMMYSLRRGFLPSPSQISFWMRSARNSRSFRYLQYALFAAPCLPFLSNNTVQLMWISGRSMTPFLNTDFNRSTAQDLVLVSRWNPGYDLHRGDVITFYTPHDPEKMAVKRVLALEGDRVAARKSSELGNVVVPKGCLWVEGDNPEGRFSMDSNSFGPISQGLITGKVIAGVLPRFSWVRWQDWKKSKRVTENFVIHNYEAPGAYRNQPPKVA